MIPFPFLDPAALSSIPAEEWERPLSEPEQEQVREWITTAKSVPMPPCLERRAEDRPTDPDFRTVRQ